jgi:acetyl esterase/lipase
MGTFLDYYTGEVGLSEKTLACWHHVSSSNNRSSENGADHYSEATSEQSSSASADLSNIAVVRALGNTIPSKHQPLFPQLSVNILPEDQSLPSYWPPTCLVHGTSDTAVPFAESVYLSEMLKEAGVEVELVKFDGKEHSFDLAPGADSDPDLKWPKANLEIREIESINLGEEASVGDRIGKEMDWIVGWILERMR